MIQIQSCIFFVLPCIAFPRNSSTAASLDNMLAGTSRGPRNISASQNPGGDSAQAWRTNRNNKEEQVLCACPIETWKSFKSLINHQSQHSNAKSRKYTCHSSWISSLYIDFRGLDRKHTQHGLATLLCDIFWSILASLSLRLVSSGSSCSGSLDATVCDFGWPKANHLRIYIIYT